MSATILWEPTGKGKSLDVWSPSVFIAAMEQVFGSLPVILGGNAVDLLRAMSAATSDAKMSAVYSDLADAIEAHGEVRLWAEY